MTCLLQGFPTSQTKACKSLLSPWLWAETRSLGNWRSKWLLENRIDYEPSLSALGEAACCPVSLRVFPKCSSDILELSVGTERCFWCSPRPNFCPLPSRAAALGVPVESGGKSFYPERQDLESGSSKGASLLEHDQANVKQLERENGSGCQFDGHPSGFGSAQKQGHRGCCSVDLTEVLPLPGMLH